jgi:hypothetical protein
LKKSEYQYIWVWNYSFLTYVQMNSRIDVIFWYIMTNFLTILFCLLYY